MQLNQSFWYGVAAGVVGTWALHKFWRPMASNKPAQ